MLEGPSREVPLGYTDGEVVGFGDGIKLGHASDEVLGFTLGSDDGTELICSNGSFDHYNDGKPEVVLLGDSIG